MGKLSIDIDGHTIPVTVIDTPEGFNALSEIDKTIHQYQMAEMEFIASAAKLISAAQNMHEASATDPDSTIMVSNRFLKLAERVVIREDLSGQQRSNPVE
jgi:hypothetical protein